MLAIFWQKKAMESIAASESALTNAVSDLKEEKVRRMSLQTKHEGVAKSTKSPSKGRKMSRRNTTIGSPNSSSLFAEIEKYKKREKEGKGKAAPRKSEVRDSRELYQALRDIKSLKAERDGLVDIIDALTTENNAIALAKNNDKNTLPLHMVQMLEIMPWDERAAGFASAIDEVRKIYYK